MDYSGTYGSSLDLEDLIMQRLEALVDQLAENQRLEHSLSYTLNNYNPNTHNQGWRDYQSHPKERCMSWQHQYYCHPPESDPYWDFLKDTEVEDSEAPKLPKPKSDLEAALEKYIANSEESYKKFQTMEAQLKKISWQLAEIPPGTLPSTTKSKPEEASCAVTLRSGREVPEPAKHQLEDKGSRVEAAEDLTAGPPKVTDQDLPLGPTLLSQRQSPESGGTVGKEEEDYHPPENKQRDKEPKLGVEDPLPEDPGPVVSRAYMEQPDPTVTTPIVVKQPLTAIFSSSHNGPQKLLANIHKVVRGVLTAVLPMRQFGDSCLSAILKMRGEGIHIWDPGIP